MRVRNAGDGLSLHAVAGSHVVVLGIDLPKEQCAGLLGFGIQRSIKDGPAHWLQGSRIFPYAADDISPGTLVDTNRHPIQDFLWSDFTAEEGTEYTYRVVAMREQVEHPTESESVSVTLTTESPEGGDHDVYFNRGAAASQQYARKFHNRPPDQEGPAAWTWLSRGLVEALQGFIALANGAEWGLRVAAYEFTYGPVLESLRDAHLSGADVRIIYHARERDSEEHDRHGNVKHNADGTVILTQAGRNRQAVRAAKIVHLCKERQAKTKSDISHNKFIVLLKNDSPEAVLTGSTNFTEGGIFGHSNLVHIVQDRGVAQAYLDYWKALHRDPETNELAPRLEAMCSIPELPPVGTSLVYSPRTTTAALDYYARIGAHATKGLFMTFAFGMDEIFQTVYRNGTAPLRYALIEKEVLPREDKVKEEEERQKIRKLRWQVENVFAIGALIPVNAFDVWLKEKLTGLNPNVKYLHTKYMLVDPLGDDPIVVSGSANFSKPSCTENDENMMVVHGNKRVADIYLGEFMRLHRHFAFREWVATHPEEVTHPEHEFLDTTDTWWEPFFEDTKNARRRTFFA
jgi:phosphatidylserine/phosphatidylglycerophosphate/cardiolipin synthase-like enzyme